MRRSFSARHLCELGRCFIRRGGHCRGGSARIELAREDVIQFERKRFGAPGDSPVTSGERRPCRLSRTNTLASVPCVARPPNTATHHQHPQPKSCKYAATLSGKVFFSPQHHVLVIMVLILPPSTWTALWDGS